MATLFLFFSLSLPAQTFQVIHNFGAPMDGRNPYASLTPDGQGNLFGTTLNGGDASCGLAPCGTVFELSPDGHGGWSEKVLHSFNGLNGEGGYPTAPVLLGRAGKVYGVTNCIQDCFVDYGGTVFKLAPNSDGIWRETTLYSFTAQGCAPFLLEGLGTGGIIDCSVQFGPDGRLYAATVTGPFGGGDCGLGCGTLFSLGQISALNWYYLSLYDFSGANDGAYPQGLLTFDADGNIYGTTGAGGTANKGTVYKLSPNRGRQGWTQTVLYSFQGGADGVNPVSGLTFDASGNLYGTTLQGGAGRLGTVFVLSPQSNGPWTHTVLYSFVGNGNAKSPNSSLSFDAFGALYGTAAGGAYGEGAIFKLTPSNGSWTESRVYSFTGGADGANPNGGVIFDAHGNLYGTAAMGGAYPMCDDDPYCGGVAYEITP